MHPGQQGVVAQIAKMRNTAFIGSEIAYRRVYIDRLHASPTQADHRLRIEIEPAHPAVTPHDFLERLNGINAKAVQGIPDAHPQGFKVGPAIRHLAPIDAKRRGVGIEYRLAKHHGRRAGLARQA